MDGFVSKKPRVKDTGPSLEVFKPAPRISPLPLPPEAEAKVESLDEPEELLDDRDEFLDEHWERNAPKRKEFRTSFVCYM